jgi:hypothetical protein
MDHICTEDCDTQCRMCQTGFCICTGFGFNNKDTEFCSASCMENFQERMAERQLEDYYGGNGPQTDRERYEIAAQQKRGMR